MEWINSLNKTLKYIEQHLSDEELNMENIAKATMCSPFFMQRMFYFLTDMSLSEYVRARKLSMAGQELQVTKQKVIDVAFKYGYETPESFTKAFKRFHGVSPSAAKQSSIQLKYLNPLQIKIDLSGGSVMDYRIEEMQEIKVVGMVREFNAETSFSEIPPFWNEYCSSGLDEKVMGTIGVCFEKDTCPLFDYMIGTIADENTQVPKGFEKRTIKPHTWAKFKAIGPLPTSIQKLNRQIFSEWLPNNTEYDIAQGINIEMYSQGDTTASDYESEIWIPITKK